MVAPTASRDDDLVDADNYGMHERTGLLSASSFSTPAAVVAATATSSPGISFSISGIFASYGSIASNRNNNNNNNNNADTTASAATTSRSVSNGDDSSVEVEREEGRRNSVVDIEGGSGSGSNRQQRRLASANSDDGDDDENSSDGEVREPQQQQQQETSDETTEEEPPRDGPTGALTRQLRCLFSAITFPIVPLGTLVSMALLWVLYAATSLDLRKPCSHPLHSYAIMSLMLVAYIPNHSQVRSQIFHYSRERDGPVRPARVRVYDQFFHTICLLYVYTGATLIQTCREDLLDRNSNSSSSVLEQFTRDGIPLNACEATCPNLYEALSVYVATLELFTFALILPLLFLPCIYLWFLQRATAEANEFARLQTVLQEEDALLGNGGVTTGEILDNLESVKIVSYRTGKGSSSSSNKNNNKTNEEPVVEDEANENDFDIEQQQLWVFPCNDAPEIAKGKLCQSKECCICMSEFDVQVNVHEQDDPTTTTTIPTDDTLRQGGQSTSDENEINNKRETTESAIVRTRCGHLFHRECLKGWVGGMWTANVNNNNSDSGDNGDWRKRRARQIHCPLCREDLRPGASRS